MQARLRLLAHLMLSALATASAFAQTSPPSNARRSAGAVRMTTVTATSSAVTGAPYSAEEVTERVRTLADGTHITQPPTTTRIYRDSAGRTRTERPAPPSATPGPDGAQAMMVVITDPVAHLIYTLHASDKVARRQNLVGPGRQPSLRRASSPAAPAQGTSAGEGPQTTVEKLGVQTIEGVTAEGTRRTTTWPVGSRGNDQPITGVSETWRSPELKVVVLSTDRDPLSGETTRKLINIVRGEPDPALFQPPPDYTIVPQGPEGSFHD